MSLKRISVFPPWNIPVYFKKSSRTLHKNENVQYSQFALVEQFTSKGKRQGVLFLIKYLDL